MVLLRVISPSLPPDGAVSAAGGPREGTMRGTREGVSTEDVGGSRVTSDLGGPVVGLRSVPAPEENHYNTQCAR